MIAHASHATTPDRRREILDAALACFSEQGVAGTTIADLRHKSKASTGSIYHHFGDKDGVAAGVYLEILRRYQASALEVLDMAGTAEALVKGIVRHFLDWVMANRAAARFLVEMRHAETVLMSDKSIRLETRRAVERINAELDRYVGEGALRLVPSELYAAIIFGPCHAAAEQWLRSGARGELTAVKEPLAEAAWCSLAPPR